MDWSSDIQRKRPPGDDLLEEQPLSKRLEKLSLVRKVELLNKSPRPLPSPSHSLPPSQLQPQEGERMEVDNVVYIDNLDDEIASYEADSDASKRLVFLPDIEKQLTRIPYLLAGKGSSDDSDGAGSGVGGGVGGNSRVTSTDLVLYSVPSSLSVSEERDSVRKVIIEARNRIRKKQADEVALATTATVLSGEGKKEEQEEWGDWMEMNGDSEFYEDPDAMDIG